MILTNHLITCLPTDHACVLLPLRATAPSLPTHTLHTATFLPSCPVAAHTPPAPFHLWVCTLPSLPPYHSAFIQLYLPHMQHCPHTHTHATACCLFLATFLPLDVGPFLFPPYTYSWVAAFLPPSAPVSTYALPPRTTLHPTAGLLPFTPSPSTVGTHCPGGLHVWTQGSGTPISPPAFLPFHIDPTCTFYLPLDYTMPQFVHLHPICLPFL